MKNKVISATFSVMLFLLILTFSIGLPIYFRPFYYAQIDFLRMTEYTDFTKAEIKEAYNEVLDYLTLPGYEFGTGVMKHSPEGASHFADCKVLFTLNAVVLVISALAVCTMLVLRKLGKLPPLRCGKFSAAFPSGIAAVVLPTVLGGLCALNFDRAFAIFHALFFPGKDNWLFDPRTDEIIRVMPQAFFMNCAILIAASVLIISATIVAVEVVKHRRRERLSQSESA